MTKPQEEFLTYAYRDQINCLRMAQGLYDEFCERLKTDPERAKVQLISSIQSALKQAYLQGKDEA